MRQFPAPNWSHLGLGAWTVGIAALGFVPGFDGPTYPLGIVVGVTLGVVGALASANAAARRVRSEPNAPRGRALPTGVVAALRLFLLASGVALLHGARVGFCDLGDDLLRWLLGPGAGAVAAGVWGALAGVAVPGRKAWRWSLAVALPVASYGVSLWRFYTTPMVFAFDHFVGYFAGTLYDTELGPLDRLWTYRLATFGFVLCAGWLVTSVSPKDRLEFRSTARAAWGVAGALLAVVVTLRGPQFGHYQTVSSIQEVLHHRVDSPRCSVLFGPLVPVYSAELLAWECSAHVSELERYFEVRAPDKTTVYLFQSAEQKAWLMGARHVYVAKPWREEIYVQAQGFPHPVLRHELAHVVAGRLGEGPFKIAGALWGLSPDPGRIEGFATAAAPSEDDPLTSHQWAAAMKKLGLLPPLGELFQLGFFGSNSSTAYTVAGAFVEWTRQTFGAAALARWYGGATLEEATGSPAHELESRFLETLDAVALSDAELAAARARFERPAVLARRCPYMIDASLSEGLGLLAAGDCADAEPVLRDVLATEPQALRAELGLAQCSQNAGAWEQAVDRYSRVSSSPHANSIFRAVALERLGDVAWQRGDRASAQARYEAAQALLVEEERLRQLDVKLLALSEADERTLDAVFSLFFGAHGEGSMPLTSGLALGRWLEATDSTLAHYLVGKQLWSVEKWQDALVHLKTVVSRGGLPARVIREATRGTLVAACATGDIDGVKVAAGALARDTAFPVGARAAWTALADRCTSPR